MGRMATLALIAAGLSVSLSQTADATAQTCEGQHATVVGSPKGTVIGTSGADVIVSNGATSIYAGDGDDIICLTALRARTDLFADDTSPTSVGGDDSVHVSAAGASDEDQLDVYLGTGDDAFMGGQERDRFQVIEQPGDGGFLFGGHKIISTGGGIDKVVLRRDTQFTGSIRLRLGPGADDARIFDSAFAVVTELSGGAGVDRLSLLLDNSGAPLNVSPAHEQVSLGQQSSSLRAFEKYSLLNHGTIRFTGADAAESIDVGGGAKSVTADLGGGDDFLRSISSSTLRARGGSGDDIEIGFEGDDALLGGPGNDKVVGGRGNDLCHAEREVQCNRN